MARTCAHCNVPVPPAGRFCDRCGAPLPASPEEPAREAWGRWIDPTENAFAVSLPATWQARGGVMRPPPYGLPALSFEARPDPSSRVSVTIGGQAWQFVEAPPAGFMGGLMGGLIGGLMGMGGAGPTLPFGTADGFAQSWLLPRVRQTRPDCVVVEALPQPEAEARSLQELGASASARGLFGMSECSVADLHMRYTEEGVAFDEVARVRTSRLRMPSNPWMGGPPPTWFGEVVFFYRAPSDQFPAFHATLRAIATSLVQNPAWQQQQVAGDNARAAAMQQQNSARLQKISRTLSETSDIVADSYWSRQQIQQQHAAGREAAAAASDPMRDWSNAMLGWEDRHDDQGQRFSVEAGHQRVWRDNQGSFHYGDALSNPDPAWHELKPDRG